MPDALGDAFTTAQAHEGGLGRGALRQMAKVSHGLRAQQSPRSLADRCRALRLVLPDEAVFSHVTAARLHELWLPPLPTEGIDVTVPPGVRPPRRKGVTAHVGASGRQNVGGLPLSPPPDVFAQLAEVLDLRALVVLGDSVVRWRWGWTLEDLHAALRPGARGVGRARRALTLVRAGSNSPRESLVRLFVLDAGLPEPELNAPVVIGGRCEYGDLVWREARVVGEYQGGYHYATDAQRLRDIDRSAWFRRHGFTVIEMTKTHLASRGAVDDLLDELARALRVEPLPRAARGRLYREPAPRCHEGTVQRC